LPQTLALTYETPLVRPIRLQAHLFSLLVFTSAGGRVIVPISQGSLRPYLFTGFGFTHKAVGEIGNPAGHAEFFWYGGGIRWWMGHLLLFAELSGFSDEPWETEEGTDSPSMGFAIGALWSWGR
jgi:hypothetical protein